MAEQDKANKFMEDENDNTTPGAEENAKDENKDNNEQPTDGQGEGEVYSDGNPSVDDNDETYHTQTSDKIHDGDAAEEHNPNDEPSVDHEDHADNISGDVSSDTDPVHPGTAAAAEEGNRPLPDEGDIDDDDGEDDISVDRNNNNNSINNNNNNTNNDTNDDEPHNDRNSKDNTGDNEDALSLSVLSYNIFVRPPGIKTNQSDHKLERIQMFLDQEIENFDIVCLQEMFGFGSGKKKKFIEQAATAGLVYHADVPVSWKNRLKLKLIDSGLLILSRHPLMETDYVIFSQGRNADGWCNKGALYAKIKTGATPMQIITTHLQAGYTYNDNNDIQTIQLSEFHNFVKSKLDKNPESPMVLVGDFNVNGRRSADDGNDSDEYLRMMEKLKFEGCETRDLIKECYNGEHPVTTNDALVDKDGKWKPRETVLTSEEVHMKCKCLDYILYITPPTKPSKLYCQPVSEQSRVEPFFVVTKDHVPFTQLSDHYGVSSRFKVQ